MIIFLLYRSSLGFGIHLARKRPRQIIVIKFETKQVTNHFDENIILSLKTVSK